MGVPVEVVAVLEVLAKVEYLLESVLAEEIAWKSSLLEWES